MINILTLLQPIGGIPSTGSGSKTGAGQGAAGFEQLLLGILGPSPVGLEGQVPTLLNSTAAVPAADKVAASAAALSAAASAAGIAQSEVPVATEARVSLVEAAKAAVGSGAAAENTGTDQTAGQTGKRAEGAVSQALLQNVLPNAQKAGNGDATVPTGGSTTGETVPGGETAQKVANTQAGIQTAVTSKTPPAQAKAAEASLKQAGETVRQAANTVVDTVTKDVLDPAKIAAAAEAAKQAAAKATTTASKTATTAASAAVTSAAATAASGAAVVADDAADVAAEATAKTPAKGANAGEIATTKSTIQTVVLQAPGAEAPRPAATSGRNAEKGAIGAATKPARPAALPSREDAVEQVRGSTAQQAAAQSQPKAGTGGAPAPLAASPQAASYVGTVELTPVFGSGAAALDPGVDVQSATQTAARSGTPTFTPAAEQVAVQFSRALASGADHITIRLQPESLGRVDVQVELSRDGRLSAMFIADRPETLDMLQRDARVLERALNDAGLRAETGGLSFNLRNNGGELPQFANQSGGSGGFDQFGDGSDTVGDGVVARHAALNPEALLDIQV